MANAYEVLRELSYCTRPNGIFEGIDLYDAVLMVQLRILPRAVAPAIIRYFSKPVAWLPLYGCSFLSLRPTPAPAPPPPRPQMYHFWKLGGGLIYSIWPMFAVWPVG